MPSQFPALRVMVASQMEGYRQRIAQRIREEAARHGESAPDLAHEIGAYPSTVERWFRGDRTPQRRNRKALAQHWSLPLDEFEPDLAAEERRVRAQLRRIEAKLDALLTNAGVDPSLIEAEQETADFADRQHDPSLEPHASDGPPPVASSS